MICKTGKLFTSILQKGEIIFNDTEITEVNQKHFLLSLHTMNGVFDFTPVDTIKEEEVANQPIVKFVAEAPNGKTYTLMMDSEQRVFSFSRGYVEAGRLNSYDVLCDASGMKCKVASKERTSYTGKVVSIKTKFHNNFFFNGILVRSV